MDEVEPVKPAPINEIARRFFEAAAVALDPFHTAMRRIALGVTDAEIDEADKD